MTTDIESETKKLTLPDVNVCFSSLINEMKEAVIGDLKKLDEGYVKYKRSISQSTGIPVDILTVLLKQLKIEGKIRLFVIWSEKTGMPNGSGYCLTDNLEYKKTT